MQRKRSSTEWSRIIRHRKAKGRETKQPGRLGAWMLLSFSLFPVANPAAPPCMYVKLTLKVNDKKACMALKVSKYLVYSPLNSAIRMSESFHFVTCQYLHTKRMKHYSYSYLKGQMWSTKTWAFLVKCMTNSFQFTFAHLPSSTFPPAT